MVVELRGWYWVIGLRSDVLAVKWWELMRFCWVFPFLGIKLVCFWWVFFFSSSFFFFCFLFFSFGIHGKGFGNGDEALCKFCVFLRLCCCLEVAVLLVLYVEHPLVFCGSITLFLVLIRNG